MTWPPQHPGPPRPAGRPGLSTGVRVLIIALAGVSILATLFLCVVTTPGRYVYHRVQLFLDERTVQPRPSPPVDLPSDPFVSPSPGPT